MLNSPTNEPSKPLDTDAVSEESLKYLTENPIKPLKMANIVVDVPIFLAPLSGVTDPPFRIMAKRFGANYLISEMIASFAAVHKAREAARKAMPIKTDSGTVAVVQIAGGDPELMAEAARINVALGADIIDINFGCPVKKVVNSKAGSVLMKEPCLATEIVERVVKAVEVPVTVKTRIGWNMENLNAPDLARRFQEAGAQMVTIHGRTRCQMFNGRANWGFVSQVKEKIDVPLLVNGDIRTVEDVLQALRQSGADGVMVGRACYGKPWLIGNFIQYFKKLISNIELRNKNIDKPLSSKGLVAFNNSLQMQYSRNRKTTGEIALEHFEEMLSFYQDHKRACQLARKHMSWYSGGFSGSASFRAQVNMLDSPVEIRKQIKGFFEV